MLETKFEHRACETLLQCHDVQPDGSLVRTHGESVTCLKFRPCPEVASDGVYLKSIVDAKTKLVSDSG